MCPYVVVDESRSATSTALLARIDGPACPPRRNARDPAQIAAMIDAGKATVAITIPPISTSASTGASLAGRNRSRRAQFLDRRGRRRADRHDRC
jgi:hypothetical protein